MHCFLVLFGYSSESNLSRFLREIVARLEAFPLLELPEKKHEQNQDDSYIHNPLSFTN